MMQQEKGPGSMTEVKRYWMDAVFFAGTWTVAMNEDPAGEYVRYSDYQALLQELNNLQQPTERQAKIEAYMLALADDIKYQEERIAKGYDIEDRIRQRVADYREIYPKEGQASA